VELFAALDPLFVRVRVYVVVPPTFTVATPSVFVTAKSAVGFTVSVSVAVLSAGVGSVVPAGEENVFATLPLIVVTVAVIVKLILPPLGKVGITTVPASRFAIDNCPAPAPAVGQTAPPADAQTPNAVFVNPAATGSLIVTPFAEPGPLLVRVRVYVVVPPAFIVATPSVFVTTRSADGGTVTVTSSPVLMAEL